MAPEQEPAAEDNAPDWGSVFARQSRERRVLILKRAACLMAASGTNENEKAMGIQQLQAALAVDPELVLEVLTSTKSGVSEEDLAKAQQQAATAQSNFEGMVKAVQTLRASLVGLRMIAKDDRLPETAKQWREAIDSVVERERKQLDLREVAVQRQQQELEARRAEILAEIDNTRQVQAAIASLGSLLSGPMAAMQDRIGELFREEIQKVAAAASGNVERMLVEGLGTLTDQSGAKIAKAREAIESIAFGSPAAKNYEIGQMVKREGGIYLGVYEPKDGNGKDITDKKYAIFVDPEDLKDSNGNKVLLTYKAAAEEVGKSRNINGKKGHYYANHEAIHKALEDGSYDGEWIIPTREILHGKNGRGSKVQEDNMLGHRVTGDFDGTYTTTASSSDFAHRYWSSTEDCDHPDSVWNVRFTDGHVGYYGKDSCRLSVRRVRLKELRS